MAYVDTLAYRNVWWLWTFRSTNRASSVDFHRPAISCLFQFSWPGHNLSSIGWWPLYFNFYTHTHTLYIQIKITPRARSASPYIEIEMGLPGKASDRLLAISIFTAIVLADTWAELCPLGYYVWHIQLGSSQPRLNVGPTPVQTPLDPCGSAGLDNPTGTPSEPQSLLSTVTLCMFSIN